MWLIPEYIVLVLLLGAARAWLFPHVGPEVGNGIGWILAFAIAGTLFVIPTAGEVPIIQAMLSLGVGVGPAGALLMVLPPISVPSLAMVGRAFSPRLLAAVTVGIVAIGVVGGARCRRPAFLIDGAGEDQRVGYCQHTSSRCTGNKAPVIAEVSLRRIRPVAELPGHGRLIDPASRCLGDLGLLFVPERPP